MEEQLSLCKSCGAPILWIEMESKKMMPVDAGVRQTIVWATAAHKKGVIRTGWIPHWTTCPKADAHRKPKGVKND